MHATSDVRIVTTNMKAIKKNLLPLQTKLKLKKNPKGQSPEYKAAKNINKQEVL